MCSSTNSPTTWPQCLQSKPLRSPPPTSTTTTIAQITSFPHLLLLLLLPHNTHNNHNNHSHNNKHLLQHRRRRKDRPLPICLTHTHALTSTAVNPSLKNTTSRHIYAFTPASYHSYATDPTARKSSNGDPLYPRMPSGIHVKKMPPLPLPLLPLPLLPNHISIDKCHPRPCQAPWMT